MTVWDRVQMVLIIKATTEYYPSYQLHQVISRDGCCRSSKEGDKGDSRVKATDTQPTGEPALCITQNTVSTAVVRVEAPLERNGSSTYLLTDRFVFQKTSFPPCAVVLSASR